MGHLLLISTAKRFFIQNKMVIEWKLFGISIAGFRAGEWSALLTLTIGCLHIVQT